MSVLLCELPGGVDIDPNKSLSDILPEEGETRRPDP